MKELYEWLGKQAESEFREYEEGCLSMGEQLGAFYRGWAFVVVRAHMRDTDPSLPYASEIDDGRQM